VVGGPRTSPQLEGRRGEHHLIQDNASSPCTSLQAEDIALFLGIAAPFSVFGFVGEFRHLNRFYVRGLFGMRSHLVASGIFFYCSHV
jgi:hypothetical protein